VLIERRKTCTANIGLFDVGHDTYWGQFDPRMVVRLTEIVIIIALRAASHMKCFKEEDFQWF